MSTAEKKTDHLRGLVRLSPCCIEPIYHPYKMGYSYKKDVCIKCSKCHKVVHEHILVNDRGEVVWPPPKEWIDQQPPVKKRKRDRRTAPREQEPAPYRVILKR